MSSCKKILLKKMELYYKLFTLKWPSSKYKSIGGERWYILMVVLDSFSSDGPSFNAEELYKLKTKNAVSEMHSITVKKKTINLAYWIGFILNKLTFI